jgi:hypothetical protein
VNASAPTKGQQIAAYVPSAPEERAADRVRQRLASSCPSPKFKVEHTGPANVTLTPDHPNGACATLLLADALGTTNGTFANGLLNQLVNVARTGKQLTADELNFALAAVRGIGPRDETEALLATQMVAIHNATVSAARRLAHVETLTQQEGASTMLNKLARTFAGQVETLKKYRSTGEQNIKVQHVTVADGGQAVIGNVSTGGGARGKN